jgi:pimeloyl-ACP methyl ester carboxylesterase
MASRIDAIIAFDRESELGGIRTPTLALCARMISYASVLQRKLAHLIPGAKLHLLERGGHGAAITESNAFMSAVMQFLLPLKEKAC